MPRVTCLLVSNLETMCVTGGGGVRSCLAPPQTFGPEQLLQIRAGACPPCPPCPRRRCGRGRGGLPVRRSSESQAAPWAAVRLCEWEGGPACVMYSVGTPFTSH